MAAILKGPSIGRLTCWNTENGFNIDWMAPLFGALSRIESNVAGSEFSSIQEDPLRPTAITMVTTEAWIGHARQDNNEDDRWLSASWISTRSPRKFEQNVPLLPLEPPLTNETKRRYNGDIRRAVIAGYKGFVD